MYHEDQKREALLREAGRLKVVMNRKMDWKVEINEAENWVKCRS